MKKRKIFLILSLVFSSSLLCGCSVINKGEDDIIEPETPSKPETQSEPETQTEPETPSEPETPGELETPVEPEKEIYNLEFTKSLKTINSTIAGVEPYTEHGLKNYDLSNYDFSNSYDLLTSLNVHSSLTKLPSDESKLPKGYSKEALIEWGKSPGLGVNILQNNGYSGKNSVVSYIDQPINSHIEYDSTNIHYYNLSTSKASMHGPAVLSLLAGKDIGIIPDSEVYFLAISSYFADQIKHAEGLYKIIDLNKSLPENKKIKMVGFSDTIDRSEKNPEAFEEAVKACEKEGIMVWMCNYPFQIAAASFIPLSDKNNPYNVVKANWWNKNDNGDDLLYVPVCGRTTASNYLATSFDEVSNYDYTYYGNGGLSWGTPYVLGLVSEALSIDESLNQEKIVRLLFDTAYKKINGMSNLINPIGFIAKVLEGVGKNVEASKLRDEEKENKKYEYCLLNKGRISSEDLDSIYKYLGKVSDANIVCVDVKNYSSAVDIYNLIKKDSETRDGKLVGIQIFGDEDI